MKFARSTTTALASAAPSLVQIFYPNADPQPLQGVLMPISPSTTQVVFDCPTGEDSTNCGFGVPGGVTVTIISTSIYEGALTAADFSMSFSCDVSTTASDATCIESYGGASANFPGVSTNTYNGTSFALLGVTITSSASGAAATGSLSSTGTGTAKSGSVTGSASGTGMSSSSSAASSGSKSGAVKTRAGVFGMLVALAASLFAL